MWRSASRRYGIQIGRSRQRGLLLGLTFTLFLFKIGGFRIRLAISEYHIASSPILGSLLLICMHLNSCFLGIFGVKQCSHLDLVSVARTGLEIVWEC